MEVTFVWFCLFVFVFVFVFFYWVTVRRLSTCRLLKDNYKRRARSARHSREANTSAVSALSAALRWTMHGASGKDSEILSYWNSRNTRKV